MQNLKELLELLLKNKLDFILVGGFASVVYGSPLVTQDLDICTAITPEQIETLRGILKNYNPKHRMNPNMKPSFLENPKDLSRVKNIYLETDLGILDIMSELPPAGTFEDLKRNSIEIDLYGYKCKVISLDDLIKIKQSMKRPKDKDTLRLLLEIKKIKM